LRGELFSSCQVLEERAASDGTCFRVRGMPEVLARLREQISGR
jgi:GTP-binding protein HflX